MATDNKTLKYVPGQGSGVTPTATATPGSARNTANSNPYGLTADEWKTPVTIGYEAPKSKKGKVLAGPPGPTVKPLGQVLDTIRNMSKAQIETLQDRLVKAGLLSRKAITKGIADEDTIKAYSITLLRAARLLKTPDAILDEAAAAGAPELDVSGAARLPFSPQVSSPEEIKTALQTALTADLGYAPGDAELANLTALYQRLQIGAQRQTYDTAVSGGTATQVMPIDVFAQQQAEQLHPTDAHAKSLANLSKEFLAGIGSESTDRVF